MRIGLLSDTHGFLDEAVFEYFAQCDEVWHVGDFGPVDTMPREQRRMVHRVDGDCNSVWPRKTIHAISTP